ncbi:MAG: DNA repair protein RadC [Candidatus Sumerlaeia bacterium]|nr:DNA repair protein RadC [Candidatus Sumerlaeia bacterium]
MNPAGDLALIDAFEKIRSFLLETDPGLQATVLAPLQKTAMWAEQPPAEYAEAFLGVVLGIDRQTAAGRRMVREHLRNLRNQPEPSGTGSASEGEPPMPHRALFKTGRREAFLKKNSKVLAESLRRLLPDGNGRFALVDALAGAPTLREAVALLRKMLPLLGGLRAFEFLAQIRYPVVVPDGARQRFYQRVGWVGEVVSAAAHPQEFFEVSERIVHLTGEPLSTVNAVVGLFSGSRDMRTAGGDSAAVCVGRPRCPSCVLKTQCSFYRYRGEPKTNATRAIKTLAVAEQPRTRFETLGPSNLSEIELLALIIRTGAEGKSSLDLAREILARFGSLEALSRAGLGELCQIKGVGRAKAIEIQAALELGRRLQAGGGMAIGAAVRRSGDLFALYRGLLAHEQQESFYLIVLNARNRIQKHFLISRGTLTGSLVHPREVMKAAVKEAAAAIAFIHNHPSGDPDPSEDDREITDRLVQAARLFGIRVLDHVIIGRDNYFSFADHNLLHEG